jgi:hypothetical protein
VEVEEVRMRRWEEEVVGGGWDRRRRRREGRGMGKRNVEKRKKSCMKTQKIWVEGKEEERY